MLEHRNGGGGVSFDRGTSCDDKDKEEKKPQKANKRRKGREVQNRGTHSIQISPK